MAESGNDMKAHASTYAGFVSLLKWVVPLLAITTLIVIFVIS